MKHPYIINFITGLVLIVAGLFSYFANENHPPTALIAPSLGFLFLLMTPLLKKENKIVAHVVVVLTLLFGLMTARMAINSSSETDPTTRERRMIVFSIMSVACLGATALYVNGFIEKRKAKKASQ